MTDETPEPDQPQPDEATQRAAEALLAQVQVALTYELDDDGRTAVRGGVTRLLGNAAKLRAYPLVNADEPGFVFQPYRAEA